VPDTLYLTLTGCFTSYPFACFECDQLDTTWAVERDPDNPCRWYGEFEGVDCTSDPWDITVEAVYEGGTWLLKATINTHTTDWSVWTYDLGTAMLDCLEIDGYMEWVSTVGMGYCNFTGYGDPPTSTVYLSATSPS
jgi:hypothetical protein